MFMDEGGQQKKGREKESDGAIHGVCLCVLSTDF